MSGHSTGNEAPWPNYALPRGTTVHGYTIERVLGSGGFGITYLARDLVDQPFAIKEYFPRDFATRRALDVLASSEEDTQDFNQCLERFRREAQALVMLSRAPGLGDGPGLSGGPGLGKGPNPGNGIVRIVTYFEAHGTGFLVMAYAEGDTLARVLRQEPGGLGAGRVHSILSQLLSIAGRVHHAGLLHRDIKPGNIILSGDDRLTLIDFGSSREESSSRTKTHTAIFSAGYAPLEQMLGLPQGPFSDIYAIGAVGYHAIGGGMVDALTRNHMVSAGEPDPMPPATAVGIGRYPAPLLRAIDTALAINPGQRPRGAEAMRAIMDSPGARDEEDDPAGAPTVLVSDFLMGGNASPSGPDRAMPFAEQENGPPMHGAGYWFRKPRAIAAMVAGAVIVAALAWQPVAGFFAPGPGPPPSPRALALQGGGGPDASTVPEFPPLAFDDGKRDCERCPRMVLIPKGDFLMGIPTAEARREGTMDWDKNASPHRQVTFRRPFHISETPISRGEYNECVKASGCKGDSLPPGQPADHPVSQVSRDDALAYVSWLNKILDKRLGRAAYRLPGEAQWEYAARGGTVEARYWGDDFVDSRGDTVPRGEGGTMPLKRFRPNPFGLYDVLGHVWQWTEDQWHDDYKGAPDDGTPWGTPWTTGGPETGRWVIRGGSWSGDVKTIRAGYRDWYDRSGLRYALTGFRVARAY